MVGKPDFLQSNIYGLILNGVINTKHLRGFHEEDSGILVLGCCSLQAWAEGFYVAGDLGRSRLGYNDVYDTMFSVAGGYEIDLPFRDTFAIEVSYRDFGNIESTNGPNWRRVEITAAQLSLVSRHKFNDQFSLLARVGGAEIKQNDYGIYDDENFRISRSYEKCMAV